MRNLRAKTQHVQTPPLHLSALDTLRGTLGYYRAAALMQVKPLWLLSLLDKVGGTGFIDRVHRPRKKTQTANGV